MLLFQEWAPHRAQYSQWDAIRRKRWPDATHHSYESFSDVLAEGGEIVHGRVAVYMPETRYAVIAEMPAHHADTARPESGK